MDITEHLRKFMAQQASLPIISVTPLLEQGLVAAVGPGNTWALTEAGHTLLNSGYPTTSFAKEQTAQQELVNAQVRAALDSPEFAVELEHSEHCWEKDRNGPRIPPGALSEQIGGSHYKNFPIQPVEFIEKNGLSFLEGCVIKRMCRHDQKNGVDDLRKAIHETRLLMELHYGVSE